MNEEIKEALKIFKIHVFTEKQAQKAAIKLYKKWIDTIPGRWQEEFVDDSCGYADSAAETLGKCARLSDNEIYAAQIIINFTREFCDKWGNKYENNDKKQNP